MYCESTAVMNILNFNVVGACIEAHETKLVVALNMIFMAGTITGQLN